MNEKRSGQSERKYFCTVPRGKYSPWVVSFVGKCCFVDTETEFGVGGINLFG